MTMGLVYLCGVSLGVRLSALDWVEMTVLILIGLSHSRRWECSSVTCSPPTRSARRWAASRPCSRSPAAPGSRSATATFYQIARLLPSYWLVQASHVALGGGAWTAFGWAVIAVWSVILSLLAARAYLRDTRRT